MRQEKQDSEEGKVSGNRERRLREDGSCAGVRDYDGRRRARQKTLCDVGCGKTHTGFGPDSHEISLLSPYYHVNFSYIISGHIVIRGVSKNVC